MLDALCAVVRDRTGNDFSGYKRSTLGRRVQRRMAALGLLEPAAYLERAESDPAEAEALLHELLISVTQFFRDPTSLETLPVDSLASLEDLRVWVCGCATGEEAYSLAMVLLERRAPGAPPFTLFATDVDEGALAVARAGRYAEGAVAGVSPERLARFFVREPGGWVVGRALRDACVFSRHNLVHDPPFSRLSLVSCRNVLIYLEAPLQARLLPAFHFSLRSEGLLLLGSAESADSRPDLFEPVDRRQRLYRRLPAPVAHATTLPLASSDRATPAPTPRLTPSHLAPRAVERVLLDHYAPPGAVVSATGEVLYLCGPTSRFLEAPTGPAPFDLASLLRPQLRHAFRAALGDARSRRQEVVGPAVTLAADGAPRDVSVVVRPLSELAPAEWFLVVFREVEVKAAGPAPAEPLVEQLERELQATRDQWRATRHELEESNDELRTSNEEYQSLNEELHTSREELQSINEELQSVNAELRQKIEALDETHGDLQNLFEATDVGAILLDASGRIRRFTPAATELFPLVPADVGRPLAHIAPRAPELSLDAQIRAVTEARQAVSAVVVRPSDGARFAVRVLPYRTAAGGVDGVVVTFVDVSVVHRAERAARDRLDDLVQVLDAVPALVVYTHDPTATDVAGNRAAAELLRLGDPARFEVLSPNRTYRLTRRGVALTRDELAITRAVRGESLQDYEATIEYADGGHHHLVGNAEPLRDPDGRVRGAVAAFVDITRRVEAENALAASEARYRTLANTAVDFIARFDRDLNYLYANPSVLGRLGATLEQLVGTSAGQPPEWQERLRSVVESGEPARFVWRGTGGEWFDVQLSPEVTDGRVTSVVSVARDVTAQKRAERDLSLSEQRYAAVFSVAAFGLLIADRATGVLLAVNPALERILEVSAHEIVGRTVVEARIVPPEERERVLVELSTKRSFRGFSTRMSSPTTGRIRSVQVNLDVVTVERDELAVVSVEDVTDQLAADLERQRLEHGLAHAQKMQAIGTLAGGVAHDFNNILAGLQGGLSLLESEVPAGPVRDELLELQALIQRGADLTRQLLGFARGGKYDVRPLALAEAVERTASMFGSTRRDIVLELVVPKGLTVSMDRSQLEQVLLNLFVNAGHAMPDGGRLRVAAAAGPLVTLTVQDTGVGMTEETKARIFEPFFTTKAPGEGTGLGLASVYGIVTNHGGTVTVESAVGVGTTFTLQLPASDGPAPVRDVTPPAPVERGRGLVLVVDDEPQVSRVFARVLELAGYSVLTAERGRDAIELVRTHGAAISAVLLDLTMPELSGGATFDAMRALRPDLQVVLCSGYGSDGPARELMARGCAAFLQKPFTARELTATLAKVLDR